MIMAEEDYVKHFGVKGQKWGVRRQRTETASRSSPKEKRWTTQQKVNFGLTVATGALFVGNILMKNHAANVRSARVLQRGRESEARAQEIIKIAGSFKIKDIKDFGG